MATRTVKSDSGNDLKLSNNGGTGSVTITDAGDLTIDSPADIVLDAEGADITLKDGGTAFGTLKQASGHLVIQPESSKEIIFNDGSGTASLTVDAANQHVSINNGSIVISTAGQGITFGGDPDTRQNSPTVGDRTLYDYEQGSWVAAVKGTDDGGRRLTMNHSTGYYTKVGNLVTVSGYFTTVNLNGGDGTASGGVIIAGLPYTVANNTGAYSGGVACYGEGYSITAGYIPTVYTQLNDTKVQLYLWDGTGGPTAMQVSEWTADGQIILNLSYRVA